MATDMSQFFRSLPEDTDADAEHEKYMMASALRSVGVEPFPNAEAGLQADIPTAMGAAPKEDALTVGDVAEDIGKGMLKGADAAGNELLQSAAFVAGAPVEAAKSVINLGLDAVGMELSRALLATSIRCGALLAFIRTASMLCCLCPTLSMTGQASHIIMKCLVS